MTCVRAQLGSSMIHQPPGPPLPLLNGLTRLPPRIELALASPDVGIEWVWSVPAIISRTCAACGTEEGRSRECQAVFVCTACGRRDNADRNSAVNILNRGNTSGVEPRRQAGEARPVCDYGPGACHTCPPPGRALRATPGAGSTRGQDIFLYRCAAAYVGLGP